MAPISPAAKSLEFEEVLSQRKVLLVTGGSRGIGAAVVRQAAADGYAVGFTYVDNATAAQQLVSSLVDAGHEAVTIHADVADPAAVVATFDAVEETLGSVTALVNNAGITGRIGPFSATTVETMRRVVDVNLLGTMYCAQEALRRWQLENVKGCMVNISSIAASLGAAHEYVHYAATKAAVETFTVGLGREVAAIGIRVNCVSPGTVYTDIHATAGEPTRPQRVVSRIPMARVGDADEIANAVRWLLSDEASYITATVLRVSGGL